MLQLLPDRSAPKKPRGPTSDLEADTEVHGEGNWGGGGSSSGAIETDRQVGLEEVRPQQAGLLDGPAFVYQRGESLSAGVEHQSCADPHCGTLGQRLHRSRMDG